jgi:hypothetical protein
VTRPTPAHDQVTKDILDGFVGTLSNDQIHRLKHIDLEQQLAMLFSLGQRQVEAETLKRKLLLAFPTGINLGGFIELAIFSIGGSKSHPLWSSLRNQ